MKESKKVNVECVIDEITTSQYYTPLKDKDAKIGLISYVEFMPFISSQMTQRDINTAIIECVNAHADTGEWEGLEGYDIPDNQLVEAIRECLDDPSDYNQPFSQMDLGEDSQLFGVFYFYPIA